MVGRKILQLIPSDGWRALTVSRGERGEAELCREPLIAFALIESEDGSTYVDGVMSSRALASSHPSFVGFLAPDEPLSDQHHEEAETVLKRAEKRERG